MDEEAQILAFAEHVLEGLIETLDNYMLTRPNYGMGTMYLAVALKSSLRGLRHSTEDHDAH